MKFWWSCQIRPVTSPCFTSHTSIESTYSGLTTLMNGGCTYTVTHIHSQTDFLCLVTCEINVFVFFSTAWVQKIKAASEEFIETEKKKREKTFQGLSPYSQLHWSQQMWWYFRLIHLCVCVWLCLFAARSVKASGIGRLLVTILEATELKAAKPSGEHENTGCSCFCCHCNFTLLYHLGFFLLSSFFYHISAMFPITSPFCLPVINHPHHLSPCSPVFLSSCR